MRNISAPQRSHRTLSASAHTRLVDAGAGGAGSFGSGMRGIIADERLRPSVAGRGDNRQMNDTTARLAMVEQQIVARGVRDPRVLSAMREIPRHEFVPPFASNA